MGDRGQVYIKQEKVYLYTHWGATNLEQDVARALAKRWRWDDPEYLARIIFCEMVKGAEAEETGFGIGTSKHGDAWKIITVCCKTKTVTVEDTYTTIKTCQHFNRFIEVFGGE